MNSSNKANCDTHFKDPLYWAKFWDSPLGGYQVLKKWLSYREHELLGRPITPDEVREFTYIARRLAALLLLQPALDANYQSVKAATYPWPQNPDTTTPAS